MSDETNPDGLRARLGKQGEEALARVAQDLLESSLVSGALQRGLGAREKAAQAQEAAMGAFNLPSAADLERLTRRVRSVGQRLEGIEDGVDRLSDRLAGGGGEERLQALEARLASLDAAIGEIAAAIAALAPVPAPEPAPATKQKPAARAAARPKPSAKRAPRKPAD